MHLIGLSGFANSGKSTVAEYLVREHGFTRLSFAAAVKDITAVAFGWDRHRLEGTSPQDRQWRDEEDFFWSQRMNCAFTPRHALQYIGTDVFRHHVLPTIWVDLVVRKIQHLPSDARVVIDDVRFVNERRALREIGGQFLLIARPTWPSPDHAALWSAARSGNPLGAVPQTTTLHRSEWDWLQDPTVATDPVIVNRGSYDDLYAEVRSWYTAQYQDAVATIS